MPKENREKTAFTTPFGLYQFTRMPFGLQGAPATFQRMVDKILNGLNDFARAYIDDVIVFSRSWSGDSVEKDPAGRSYHQEEEMSI